MRSTASTIRLSSFLVLTRLTAAAGISLLAVMAGTAHAQTARVGVASAVNPDATGQAPGQDVHVIKVGADMVHDERIVTSTKGRTHVLFLDGSALTIGPNSDIVLDEFVYDPEAKSGTIALSATKGLFRFVGGKISKKGGVRIQTPTALIGIRGGIGIITITPAEQTGALPDNGPGNGLASGAEGNAPTQLAQIQPPITTARLGFGEMTVNTGGGQRTITRPGFAVTITDPNLPPPTPVLDQGGDAEQSGLEGSGEGTGGASEQPTNEDVAGTQLADLGSNNAPTNLAPTQTGGTTPASTTTTQAEKAAAPKTAQQNTALDTSTGVSGGQRNTGVSNSNVYSGRYLSQTPFTAFDFNTAFATPVATRNQAYGSGSISGGNFTASLSGGSIMVPAKTGSFSFASDSTQSPFGNVSGTGFGAADESFFYWNLLEVQHSNNPASIFAGVPFGGNVPTSGITAYNFNVGFPGDSLIPSLPKSHGGDITGAKAHMLYVAWHPNTLTFPDAGRTLGLFGAIAIEGVGSSQRSAMTTYIGTIFGDSHSDNKLVMSGYSRGSVRLTSTSTPLRVDGGLGATSRDVNGYSFFGFDGPDHFVLSSDTTSSTTAQMQPAAGFVQSVENPGVEVASFFTESYANKTDAGNVGTNRTARTINGYVKGLAIVKLSNNTIPLYIIENNNDSPTNFQLQFDPTTNRLEGFASLEDEFSTQGTLVIRYGQLTGSNRSRQVFIDDDIFGARESTAFAPTVDGMSGSARMGLLSSAFFNTSSDVASGTSFCTCSHTKWGLTSGEVRGGSPFERHRLHLVPWVAGELGTPSIIAAMSGTATYSGHVFANIMNGSNQYVDTGNFAQTWNFATDTGTVTISDLDGASYQASLSGVSGSDGSRFNGTLIGQGAASARSGEIDGAFMKTGTDHAGELGAAFHATDSGASYYVAGIGIAKKN